MGCASGSGFASGTLPALAFSMVMLLPGPARATDATPTAGFDLATAMATAAPGDTIHIPAGVHRGPVVVDRPLSLIGAPGAIIDGGGGGDVIQVTAPDVTIRGLVIQGTGISLDQENAGITVLAQGVRIEENTLRDVLFGIYLKEAHGGVLRANHISGMDLDLARRGDAIRLWYSRGSLIEDNEVTGCRDVVIWFSDDVTLRGNHVADGRYGLHFMYSNRNLLEDNVLEGNSVGAFLMYSGGLTVRRNVLIRNRGPSGYGIGLKDMDGVNARDNLIAGNRVGVYFDNSPSSMRVQDHFVGNVFAYNDIGLAFLPAVQRNTFTGNTFLDNLEQVAVLGGGEFRGNHFTVEDEGNFWSDYAGYDLDGDGIGDLPYRSTSLFETLIDRNKKLRLFLFSPVEEAIETAARAFPLIKPRAKFSDTAPAMEPMLANVPPLRPSGRLPLALLASGLILGAAVVLRGKGIPGVSTDDKGTPSVSDSTATGRPEPGAAKEPMIEVTDLTRRFGRLTAVDHLSFTVAPGEAVALWGSNGAGKTTAIRCLLGLLRGEGRIVVAGVDGRTGGKSIRNALGYVPQELALYDNLTATETLAFFAALRTARTTSPEAALAEVGLSDHGRKKVSELSGGMKQRLALAVALLADPPVLVLDEMTSNLDSRARSGFLDLLGRQKSRGKTILFTSHRVDEIEILADRVLIMEAGRLKIECAPRDLADTVGLHSSLLVHVAPEDLDRALAALRERGLNVERDGIGIRVQVGPREKAVPIQALAGAGIEVRDFELESEGGSEQTGALDGVYAGAPKGASS